MTIISTTVGKKDLHNPDNHDGVSTHLEPDILECEVKWALGSITKNKASGGDGIPVELLQILKDDGVKVMHSICKQMWKTQQRPQDWKRSVFIPIPYNEKDIFFWVLVLEGLVGLHRTVQLQLLQHYWLGHRLGLF